MTKQKQLIEGVDGKGNTKYMVVTSEAETGKWVWVEEFKSKSEAESWLKYS